MYSVVSDKLYLSLILLSYPRCLQTCSMYVFCEGVSGVQGTNIIQCVRHWKAVIETRGRNRLIWTVNDWTFNTDPRCVLWSHSEVGLSQFIERVVGGGGEGGMKCTLFFLYLGFNLLNISKTAAPGSSVCGSSFVLPSKAHCAHPGGIFPTSLKQLTQQVPV